MYQIHKLILEDYNMFTKEKGIRDTYIHYTNKVNKLNQKPVDYKTFTAILKDFNLKLRDRVLSNETVKLPYGLGYLTIVKFENKFNEDKKHKWKVDFKKTKELGYKVYYGSEYGYRWRWIRGKCKGKAYYHFKPCRRASRLITEKLNEGNDYYQLNHKNFAI